MKHIIQNEHVEVSINTAGAELCSLREKNTHTEYLWQADENFWPRHAPILFPIVGKLSNNRYTYSGKSYEMNQHGFARDSVFHIIEKKDSFIKLELTDSSKTKKQYPAHFVLQVSYELCERTLSIKYGVYNTDNKTIHFSIGGHPAFNCPLDKEQSREDYKLEFEEKETSKTFLLKDGLLSKKQKAVIENGNTIPITKPLFNNDALIFKNLNSNKVSLVDKYDKCVLSFEFPEFPYLGIWSKNQDSPFICIEPWFGLADHVGGHSDLSEKEGILSLSPEAFFKCEYKINIF